MKIHNKCSYMFRFN